MVATDGDTEGVSLRAARRARRRHERSEVRRFTKRSRTRRNIIITVAAIALFVVAFVAVGIFTPLLSVRQVAVTGVQRADEEAIVESLNQLQGRPLAQVTDSDVAALLQPYVLVQSYSVRTEPPSKLIVDIVERVPVGAVESQGSVVIVDAIGTELWRTDALPKDIPQIKSGGIGTPGFTAATAASLALHDSFRARVQTVTARSLDSVELTLRDGTRVVWGSAENSERKAQVLEALVAATDGTPRYYDVSSPDNPVTRDQQP